MCHYYSTFRFILQPFGVPSLISLLTSAVTGRSLSDETFIDLLELLSGDIQSENPIVDLNNRHKRSDTEMSSEALNIFSETLNSLSNSNGSSINQLFRYVMMTKSNKPSVQYLIFRYDASNGDSLYVPLSSMASLASLLGIKYLSKMSKYIYLSNVKGWQ